MAIAGAVVVPHSKDCEQKLIEQLRQLPTVEVQEAGPKGIAVVMEEADMAGLRKLSEEIKAWQEVVDVQVAYINWEEIDKTGENS